MSSDNTGGREGSLQAASPSFLRTEGYFISSRKGPLATAPENGSFKVRQVQTEEKNEQSLQTWGCSEASCLNKGRHPVGSKTAGGVPGTPSDSVGAVRWCGQALLWCECRLGSTEAPVSDVFLASPPCPAAQLPARLTQSKAPATPRSGGEWWGN